MAQGLQHIPAWRIPREWSADWFQQFIREVLRFADTRNSIEGPGVTISGQPNQPATISATADILQLLEQNYVLATTSLFLPNERVLEGAAGSVEIIDQGPGLGIVVAIVTNGIGPEKFRQSVGNSVVGRPDAVDGNVVDITSSADGDVLSQQGGILVFGPITSASVSDFASTVLGIISAILTDTATVNLTFGGGPSITADVITQESITADASGIKLDGDSAAPGNSMYYGTDSGAVKGFHALPSGTSPLTTKGDLYTYSTVDTRLPVGSNGLVLTADSSQTTGLIWAPGGAGGSANITPDTHPSSPNAMDDEFEAGSLDVKWTQQNSPTSVVLASGSVLIMDASNLTDNIGAIEQPITGTFKIQAKVQITAGPIDNRGGIYVRNTGSGKLLVNGIFYSGGTTWYVNRLTNFTTISTNVFLGTSGGGGEAPSFGRDWWYQEIEYDGTDVIFRASLSGVIGTFVEMYREAAATFLGGAPDACGIYADRGSATLTPLIADWFRRIA